MLRPGFINVLKPTGMTSNDLVAKLRGMIKRAYGEKIKTGHTGTLDPNAAGVMLVALGNATKFSRYVIEKDKTYRAVIAFGHLTDTLDTYGEIIGTKETKNHAVEEIEKVLGSFLGTSMQIPPKYSALKVDGQRLYKLARENKDIPQIKAREINIDHISLLAYNENSITVDVTCSSGTYIRSLARDIGEALGELAILSLLIRTDLDGQSIEDSYTLEELEGLMSQKNLSLATMTMDSLLEKFPSLNLKSGEKLYVNGASISTSRYAGKSLDEGHYRVYHDDRFLGIGRVSAGEKETEIKSETLVV